MCNYRQRLGVVHIAIVDVHNKERGVTYVYESHSYWDKEKKQPRSHRRLIGRRDPETGEIVPTRRRKAKSEEPGPSDTGQDYKALWEQAVAEGRARDEEVVELRRRVASLEVENLRYRDKLDEVRRIVG